MGWNVSPFIASDCPATPIHQFQVVFKAKWNTGIILLGNKEARVSLFLLFFIFLVQSATIWSS